MPSDEPLNERAAITKLNKALSLQYRSAIEFAMLAGTLQGVQWQPFEALLTSYASHEVDDIRRIVQKVVAIGGTPVTKPKAFELPESPDAALRQLVEHECEAIAAFHAVIPETGQEPRSEALEHRLEHVIMRKQEQVDTLRRALGETDAG
jgi:hypothetical protein